MIEQYIINQLQKDYVDDQLNTKEYIDMFTGTCPKFEPNRLSEFLSFEEQKVHLEAEALRKGMKIEVTAIRKNIQRTRNQTD